MQHQYSSPELCSGAFWWVHCLGFTLSVPIYHPLVASQNHEIPWKETKTPSNTCTIWKGITSCLPLTWDEKFAYKLPSWNSFSGCFHFCVIEWLKKKKIGELNFFPSSKSEVQNVSNAVCWPLMLETPGSHPPHTDSQAWREGPKNLHLKPLSSNIKIYTLLCVK